MGQKPREDITAVLAANVAAVKGEDGTEADLVKRTRLGAGTVHRVLLGQNVRLRTLAQFASALKGPDGERIEAWQLLVPGFELNDPPKLFTPELSLELESLRRFQRRVIDAAENEQRDPPDVHKGGATGPDGNNPGGGNERANGGQARGTD